MKEKQQLKPILSLKYILEVTEALALLKKKAGYVLVSFSNLFE